jgi:hypothetical protein
MDIQERGDLAGAAKFASRFCVMTPELERFLKRVENFPIDIRIRYVNWAA